MILYMKYMDIYDTINCFIAYCCYYFYHNSHDIEALGSCGGRKSACRKFAPFHSTCCCKLFKLLLLTCNSLHSNVFCHYECSLH